MYLVPPTVTVCSAGFGVIVAMISKIVEILEWRPSAGIYENCP